MSPAARPSPAPAGPPVDVLLVDERTASRIPGLSARTLFDLQSRGAIPHVKVGLRVLYPVDRLRQWVEGRSRLEAPRHGGAQ